MTLLPATQRLDPWEWLGWPALAAVGLTLVFAAPLRVLGLSAPQPVFPAALGFAWAVIRPSVLAPFVLLVLGLLLDVFWGGPLGLWALSLICGYGVILSARPVLSGLGAFGLGAWYVFSVICAFVCALAVTALDSAAVPALWALAIQFAATLALFPFAYRLIQRYEDADVRFR